MTAEQETQLLALLNAVVQKSIDLGKVAIRPRGAYNSSTEYEGLDFVKHSNSCYLSLADNNQGNPLTDTTKWMNCLDGEAAVVNAALALEKANLANAAATRADESAVAAGAKATLANLAAQSAAQAILDLTESQEEVDELLPQLRSAIAAAILAYDQITSSQAVDPFASIPASMSARVNQDVLIGSSPVIDKVIYPQSANQSVVFQVASEGGYVNPDGIVTPPSSAGQMVIHVISTMNSHVWKELVVTVRSPVALTAEDGTAITCEDGTTAIEI